MVFVGLYVVNEALKKMEEASGKKFKKRKLLVGESTPEKVIKNILGGQ